MTTVSYPALLRTGANLILAELVFRETQTVTLDPADDELSFPGSGLESFLERFQCNLEPFTLTFAGHERHFTSLENCLRVLAEAGFELLSVAFDGFFRTDEPCGVSVSEIYGLAPSNVRRHRELHSLRWAPSDSRSEHAR